MDVVVVGAGPAGAAAALALARRGHDVVIVEANEAPYDKPCDDVVRVEAAKTLRTLGLEEIVTRAIALESLRVDHVARGPFIRRSLVHCNDAGRISIPSRRLVESLRRHALKCGARFVTGRVEDWVDLHAERVCANVRGPDDRLVRIEAKRLIAADGARSSMRRAVEPEIERGDGGWHSARRYFHSPSPPARELYWAFPLTYRGATFAGHLWVTPVGPDELNVGVRYFQERGFAASLAIEPDDLLDYLVQGQLVSARFGELMGISNVCTEFQPGTSLLSEACADLVAFAGDAAGLADPLLGTGLTAALLSGSEVAREIDDFLRNERPVSRITAVSHTLRRGIDCSLLVREHEQIADEAMAPEADPRAGVPGHPLLRRLIDMAIVGRERFSIAGTPVAQELGDGNLGIATAFVDFDRFAREFVWTDFPFSSELTMRILCAQAGPTCAAVLLGSNIAMGGSGDAIALSAALAGEMLGVASSLQACVAPAASAGATSLGNGLATLMADHALSCLLRATATLKPLDAGNFARVSYAAQDGAMLDIDDAWRTARSPKRYLAAAFDSEGALHEHAASLGARLAGEESNSDELREFGRNVGVALRIANDVFELLAGDAVLGTDPGDCLRHGNLSLPVIYALERDPRLADLLSPHLFAQSREAIVDRIRNTDAVSRCVAECEHYANSSRAALERLNSEAANVLESFPQLAVARCADESG